MTTPFNEGYEAGINNLSYGKNPYDIKKELDLWSQWADGYHDGMAIDIQRNFKGYKKPSWIKKTYSTIVAKLWWVAIVIYNKFSK